MSVTQEQYLRLAKRLQDNIDNISLTPGADVPEVQAEYSADGLSWHEVYAESDGYIHFSTDGGSTWGDTIYFKGPQGEQGEAGSGTLIDSETLNVHASQIQFTGLDYSVNGPWRLILNGISEDDSNTISLYVNSDSAGTGYTTEWVANGASSSTYSNQAYITSGYQDEAVTADVTIIYNAVADLLTIRSVASRRASSSSREVIDAIVSKASTGNITTLTIKAATADGFKAGTEAYLLSMSGIGQAGPAGVGVATGGTAGQYLRKTSGVDYETAFASIAETEVAFTDVTTNDASTAKHGYAPKAIAPAAGLYNYVGITNTETAYTNKALFDATVPSTQAFGDAASAGSAAVAARRDHKHAMPAAEKDTTAVTGILKGNGSAISAASAGTDYQSPLTADTHYLTPGTAASTYEPKKGDDDNFVTDAEKTKLSNLSGTNTGDQDLSGLIAKTTNITSLNETGIADGEIAIFNLTSKDIRTSNVTISTTLVSADTNVPTGKAVADAISIAGGYTDENAQDAVGGMVADTTTIDLTYTDATPELKADLKATSVATSHLASPTGADTNVVTGTKGTSGNLTKWDANGDAIDAGLPLESFPKAVTRQIQGTNTAVSNQEEIWGLGWIRGDGSRLMIETVYFEPEHENFFDDDYVFVEAWAIGARLYADPAPTKPVDFATTSGLTAAKAEINTKASFKINLMKVSNDGTAPSTFLNTWIYGFEWRAIGTKSR